MEAARIYRETLEVERRVLGAEHQNTLSSATSLARVLARLWFRGRLARLGFHHRDLPSKEFHLRQVMRC